MLPTTKVTADAADVQNFAGKDYSNASNSILDVINRQQVN